MDIFYVKNASYRKKELAIKTVIGMENNKKVVTKSPLYPVGKAYTNGINKKYEMMKSSYKNIDVCAIINNDVEKGDVTFDFSEGKLFSEILMENIRENDKKAFVNNLFLYKELLTDFGNIETKKSFGTCDEFKEVFGEYNGKIPFEYIQPCNIDLTFDNIIAKDNRFTMIDYEWVFDFPIPVQYIIARTIFLLFAKLDSEAIDNKCMSQTETLKLLDIYEDDIEIFHAMETNFNKFAYGDNIQQILKYLKKNDTFKHLENETFGQKYDFAQLYWTNAGFSEENSVTASYDYSKDGKVIVNFDLKNVKANHYRFDPISRRGCVKIEYIRFIDEDGNAEDIVISDSNAFVSDGNKYYFPDDSQLYFFIDNEKSGSLMTVSFEIFEVNVNHLESIGNDIKAEKKMINNLNDKCNALTHEKNYLIDQVNQAKAEAMYYEDICNQMKNSKSWKLMKPFRYFVRKGKRVYHFARRVISSILHPRRTRRYLKALRFLNESKVFDVAYYVNNAGTTDINELNAKRHYIMIGSKEGRLPNSNPIYKDILNRYYEYKQIKSSKFFDSKYYFDTYSDVPKSINPIIHYMYYGSKENRNPSKEFNTNFYLNEYADVQNSGITPLLHFIQFGYFEGRKAKEEYLLIKSLPFYIKKVRMNKIPLKSVFGLIRERGLKSFLVKKTGTFHRIAPIIYDYEEPQLTQNIEKEIEGFNVTPKISIIMPVYNVDPKWLSLAIDSIRKQWYKNWELCIVDDCSTNEATINYLKQLPNDEKIKIKFHERNQNISATSNTALAMCTGEYVALIDNDDEITADAFYEVVKAINAGAEFVYSDEDKLELDGTYSEPHFKSDFNFDLLHAQNYICHLSTIKRDIVNEVGGFEVGGIEGSQDHDLVLKVIEKTNKIYHIPKVLYHWRKIPGSTAAEYSSKSSCNDASKKAIENSLKRKGLKGEVTSLGCGSFRVKYDVIGNPLISIIIPFKDKKEMLETCIHSILDKTTYQNFEIIGISNNSIEQETFECMKALAKKDNRIKFYEYNVEFNYSKINNYGVNELAQGEYIVLLNNDIEILTADWLDEMLGFAQRKDIGAVGAKLYYPNDTIQHAGVIVGIYGLVAHSHRHFHKDANGYFNRLKVAQDLSAVTAACLMVNKTKFIEVGGLNEVELKVAFNDVDFCLKLLEHGYQNLYTPFVEAIHYESISRGIEDTDEKKKRFQSEVMYMRERHKEVLAVGDRFYNKNLTSDYEDFTLKNRG